jgi:hypothetical protein
MSEDDRDELHELREQAHEAGIEGSSKMGHDELVDALDAKRRGASAPEAKAEGKRENP